MVMYAQHTHYDVIKEVAKFNFEYHLTKRHYRPWDIAWFDGPITMKLLQRMQPYQRTNHLPGIYNLAKKNMLGRHLMRLQTVFPEEYNFFPQTYNLPEDFKEFLGQVNRKRNRTFIVKPEASCQGKGIFLTRDPEALTTEKTIHTTNAGVVEHMVVQRYMHKPYLIDGFKFDLRLYVLINGVSPLRVYVFKDGLARFATVPYKNPAPSNLKNLCMHLTNYAINKESNDFVQNEDQNADDVGSKRSYQFVLKHIAEKYGLLTQIRVENEINDIIVKTMCLAQPHVHHLYRSCQPDDIENSLCFQILGFDVMIDHKLKPSLIEVNQMPSFATDSPLDYKIKHGVINDAIALLNLSAKRRSRTKNQKKQELQRRLLKGYSHKPQAKGGNDNSASITKIDKINEDSKGENNQSTEKLKTTGQNQATQGGGQAKQTMSKANLLGQSNQTQSKANLIANQATKKAIAQKAKEDHIIKKKILREKTEKALCGEYELIYPYLTYAEEEQIRLKVITLKQQGHPARSVKGQIGLDAPKTLKEKLAELHDGNSPTKIAQKEQMNRKSSQNSMPDSDQQPPQLGENTIEMAAVEKIMEEEAAEQSTTDQQQGSFDVGGPASLSERWLKQIKYENFMECTRRMWDQFNSNGSVSKQKRMRAKADELEKEKEEKERKDKARKEIARKNLTAKLKKQAEERQQKIAERQALMKQIQEEQDRGSSQDSQDTYFKDEPKKGSDKLNMAELMEQHRQLTDKIAASQQKFLEDGLERNRQRSSLAVGHHEPKRQESNRTSTITTFSMNNAIDNNFNDPLRASLKRNGPNMDYFQHIKKQKRDRQQQERAQNESQNQDSQSQSRNPAEPSLLIIKSAEGLKVRSKTEAKHKAANAINESQSSFKKNDGAVTPGLSYPGRKVTGISTKNILNSSVVANKATEEKPKGTEFPLDHILPVFNLNKKESSFIPTMKAKQKDYMPMGALTPSKAIVTKRQAGLARGSTITKANINVADEQKVNSMANALGVGAPVQIAQAAQTIVVPQSLRVGLTSPKASVGNTFRNERKSSYATTELISVGELRRSPPVPTRFTDHVLQPSTEMAIMDGKDKPMIMLQNQFEENKTSAVDQMRQKKKQLKEKLEQEKGLDISHSRQFKSLEPVLQRVPLTANQPVGPAPAPSLPYQSLSNKTREPNVIMINLDAGAAGAHNRATGGIKDLPASVIKAQHQFNQSKSPNVDVHRKLNRRLDGGNDHHQSMSANTDYHPSGKYENISVQRLPYQRNSKLNELFGDVQRHYYKPPVLTEPNSLQNSSVVVQMKMDALNYQKTQASSALKYMEQIMGESKFGPFSGNTTAIAANGKIPQNSQQSDLNKSVNVDRAILPEISDQHKSKELGKTNGSRAASNKSEMVKRENSAVKASNNISKGKIFSIEGQTVSQVDNLQRYNRSGAINSFHTQEKTEITKQDIISQNAYQRNLSVVGLTKRKNSQKNQDILQQMSDLPTSNSPGTTASNRETYVAADILQGMSLRKQKEALETHGVINLSTNDNANAYFSNFKR